MVAAKAFKGFSRSLQPGLWQDLCSPPIRDLRRQMETLLQTYCFEIQVTCAQASAQDAFVRRMALHLVQYLAVFLAETITGLLQRVLTHPARGLVDDTNAALLTQKFWVQAIYCENRARKMRTFFTRRLEPKTRSSYHIKWSNAK